MSSQEQQNGSQWKQMPRRQAILLSLAGASALPFAAPIAAMAAAAVKSPLCAPCNGHGNCESDACVDGLCAPSRDVCPGQKRSRFVCKGEKQKLRCCKENRHNCKPI